MSESSKPKATNTVQSPAPHTVAGWLANARKSLTAANIDSAALDSQLILAHVLGVDRVWLHAHDDTMLKKTDLEHANTLLDRRIDYTPVAYLIGHKEFYGHDFIVNEHVLIPRPETEYALEFLQQCYQVDQPQDMIDVGTGSGCLGISAALLFPNCRVTLSDISYLALGVAKTNCRALLPHSRNISFVGSSLLDECVLSGDTFEVIVANLPYVDRSWETSPETHHEPSLALFAADNGLALIMKLIEQAAICLRESGYLLLEADPRQHELIKQRLARHNFQTIPTPSGCFWVIATRASE